jgi:DNA polymerase-3 subunit epsilon
MLSLPTYKLSFVCDALEVPFTDHHNAAADAGACVGIIKRLAAQVGADTVEGLAAVARVSVGRFDSQGYDGCQSIGMNSRVGLRVPDTNPDANPDGYLFGKVVVFTGTLGSMSRQIAWDACGTVGAIPETSITMRTNILVMGDVDPDRLRPGAELSAKAQKAVELQARGQGIELMDEVDFLRHLGSNWYKTPAATTPAIRQGRKGAPTNKPDKPFRLLHRAWSPTTQLCSVEGCGQAAMYSTRKQPTYCDGHITQILRYAGLEPLERFTHPKDYRLTRCLVCGCTAHYRFEYVLEKNAEQELTCRACFWRAWAHRTRNRGVIAVGSSDAISAVDVQRLADEHGYDYLGPLTDPPLRDDPHHIRCRVCGRISAIRACDIGFGCTCSR